MRCSLDLSSKNDTRRNLAASSLALPLRLGNFARHPLYSIQRACNSLISAHYTLDYISDRSSVSPFPPRSSMPIPSLPVEIIEQVIKSSLPPLIFSTFKKRYSLLKRYSLVVSTWRELAQRELWREVLVTEENSSQVQRAIGQVCHEKVRGVWIGWIHETPGRVLLDLRKAGIHPRRIAAWRGQLGSMVWSLFSGECFFS